MVVVVVVVVLANEGKNFLIMALYFSELSKYSE